MIMNCKTQKILKMNIKLTGYIAKPKYFFFFFFKYLFTTISHWMQKDSKLTISENILQVLYLSLVWDKPMCFQALGNCANFKSKLRLAYYRYTEGEKY